MNLCIQRVLFATLLAFPCVLAFGPPAAAQNVRQVLYARERVFPNATNGVVAVKRDSAGRYYILAKNLIAVYDPDGQRIGRVPNANSAPGTIHYAAAFDVDSDGHILVADRGANAVEVFSPDGILLAKISVFAPVSIAALSDGQFAVATLRSQAAVEVMDEQGKVIRKFAAAPNADTSQNTAAQSLANPGTLTEDPDGHIYLATASADDPAIRKYDRYGIVSYQSPVASGLSLGRGETADRVQFGLNYRQMGYSDQFNGWATVGLSGRVDFGTSVGMGFRSWIGEPGGLNPFGAGSPAWNSGLGATNVTGVTSQGSFENGEFHLRLGLAANTSRKSGRGGTGSNGPGSSSDQVSPFGNILEFESDDSGEDTDGTIVYSNSSQGIDTSGTNSNFAAAMSGSAGMPFAGMGFGFHGMGGLGGDMFRPSGDQAALFSSDGKFTNGESFNQFIPGSFQSNGPGTGVPHFRPRGDFGPNQESVEGTIRVNLGRPTVHPEPSLAITAIGVDPETHEAWAAMGNTLVYLDENGNAINTFYLAGPDGTTLHATAIVIEPNRLIVATDSLGIFEFARPDKISTPSGSKQTIALPEAAPQQQ